MANEAARLHFTDPSGSISHLYAATAALLSITLRLACEVAPGFISLCRGKPFHSLVKTFALFTCEVAACRRVDVFLFTALRLQVGVAALKFPFAVLYYLRKEITLWLKASCAHCQLILRYKS
jgi:hypothetical protein